ncbi:MAG: Hint domain-containing protein [Myxococcaceae bacterium]|nr:Hint domain-containing protein [Myxococcaceae bacterium]
MRVPRGSRRVEALKLGDEVVCVDPETGERHVAQLCGIRSSRRECLALTVGAATLRCTSDHPLYDPDTKTWAPAGDWALGRRTALMHVPEDGAASLVRVPAVAGLAVTLDEVFDLTVDHPLHNFVAEGVLVHNKSYAVRCVEGEAVSVQSCTERPSCAAGETPMQGVCRGRPPSVPWCQCGLPDGGFVERPLGGFEVNADPGMDAGVTVDAGMRDGG